MSLFPSKVMRSIVQAAVYVHVALYLLSLVHSLYKRQGLSCSVRCPGSNGATTDMNLKVQELFGNGRVKYMRHCAGSLVHVFFVAILLGIILPEALPSSVEEGAGSSDIVQVVIMLDSLLPLIVFLLFSHLPHFVTLRSINSAYIGWSVWWLMRDTITGYSGLTIPAPMLQRFFLALLTGNARLTSACNTLITAVGCTTRILVSCGLSQECEEPLNICTTEIQATILGVVVLLFIEQFLWESACFQVEDKASTTEATVLRLLSALCDAVVTLGPDLKIVSRAPKLANLLEGKSAGALAGWNFLDLMAETDQARFRRFLEQSPELVDSSSEPTPAQALPVNLKFGTFAGVAVQLYHTHFQDSNGQLGHLICICEDGAAAGTTVQATVAPPQEDVASMIFDGDTDSSACGDSQSFSSSFNGQPKRAAIPAQQKQEVSLTFNCLSFKIWQQHDPTPVIDASLLERESLQEWVSGWVSSRAWMQDFLNAALRPVNPGSWQFTSRPSCVNFQVAFEGNCTLPQDLLNRAPPNAANASGTDGAPPRRLAVGRLLLSKKIPVRHQRSTGSQRRSRARPHFSAPLAMTVQEGKESPVSKSSVVGGGDASSNPGSSSCMRL